METPDFDQIARELLRFSIDTVDPRWSPPVWREVAAQLRQVWNLRGAADCRAIDQRLSALTGWVTSEPYRKQLRDAIEAADVKAP